MPRKTGPRRPTIEDIARKAGVSKVSVSYALNDNPGLSAHTRARILAIAAETGWHPNPAARALSASRAGACGLALARPARTLAYEPFFSKLLSGIEAELSAKGLALVLQIVEDLEAESAAMRRWWAERRVDGVLIVDLRRFDPRIAVIEELQMPAVIVGGPGPTGSVPYIPGNDGEGMRLIIEHLASLGHRRIGRVAGSPAFASTQDRSKVFRNALKAHGAQGKVVPTDFSSSAGAAATRRLLRSDQPPTAIVYDNDIMAVAGLGVAQEMGLAVPGQLCLASFEDSILCEAVRPSLTACARDVVGYGSRAAAALICLTQGMAMATPVQEAYQLMARGSTAAAPENISAIP